MARACPLCLTSLERFSQDGLELDGCPGCGGLWLDRGELPKLMRLGDGSMQRAEARHPAERGGPPAHRPCPACGEAMTPYRYAGDDIELDTCDKFCGIWCDGGELARIAGRDEEELPAEAKAKLAEYEVDHRARLSRMAAATTFLKVLSRRWGWFIP